MGATSIAMPIPAASAGRMNRMPSGGSTSSSYSQSPAGGATSLPTQSLTSLFAKHDTQPCEVSVTATVPLHHGLLRFMSHRTRAVTLTLGFNNCFFPGKPGLAGCPLDFPSPFVPVCGSAAIT